MNNDTKVPVDRQAVIDAINASDPPEGGWGEVKILLKHGRLNCADIGFDRAMSAGKLCDAIGFGKLVYKAGTESCLRIKQHRLSDISTILGRKSGALAPATIPFDPNAVVEEYAVAIDKAKCQGIELIFEIGRNLKSAHDQLAHHGDGTFVRWVESRCGISKRTAFRYLAICEAFDGQDCAKLAQTSTAEALEYLARDSSPEEAVEDAMKVVDNGERLTLAKAKELVGKYVVDEAPSPDDPNPDEQSAAPFQPAEFVTATRKHVRDWVRKCPQEDIHFLVDALREIASQIERKLVAEQQEGEVANV